MLVLSDGYRNVHCAVLLQGEATGPKVPDTMLFCSLAQTGISGSSTHSTSSSFTKAKRSIEQLLSESTNTNGGLLQMYAMKYPNNSTYQTKCMKYMREGTNSYSGTSEVTWAIVCLNLGCCVVFASINTATTSLKELLFLMV